MFFWIVGDFQTLCQPSGVPKTPKTVNYRMVNLRDRAVLC
jgi:hypothetical protein